MTPSIADENNLEMELSRQNERVVKGRASDSGGIACCQSDGEGRFTSQEIDLAAMGFKPGSLTAVGIAAGTFSTIVKVNTAVAQIA